MSSYTVLSVGQCSPDHASIARFLNQHFDVEILTADQWPDTQEALQANTVHLVLINRKLDIDYSEGMDILRAIKEQPEYANLPVMIVSNFADAQTAAVEAGAVPGFGKNELASDQARKRVASALGC